MGANAVLDIAIGLVLTYLVLSLISTVVNEYIATKLKLRSSTLQSALVEILDSPTLRADFYNHGLIDGTHQAVGEHVSYLSGQTFALALLGSLDPTKPIPGFADVKSSVEQMPDCNIRDVLLAHLATANHDLEQLRDGVARYFDSAMDRIGGLYKRYLKLISFGVATVFVVILNVDTITIGTALWKDASLRAQMVQNANSALSNQQSPAPAGEKIDEVVKGLDKLESQIRPLPIGWPDSGFKNVDVSWEHPVTRDSVLWLLAKILGLALSAFAISLGAPFWFDMLSKFMNVRGTGKKPERTDSN